MNNFLLAIATLLLSTSLLAQNKVAFSGYIKDSKNGEALIGATVYIEELKIGTSSNVYGFYSLSIPPGEYKVTYSFLGYSTNTMQLKILNTNQTVNVELQEEGGVLEDVIITGERDDANVKNMEMSVAKLDIKTISRIPPLFGEVDVVRAIQLLPGVSTVGEGASGFNVRGGSIDHNLILLDESPVYNSSHLFGFFSVFNPDAVKDVKLIKGGVPAMFGGRLASLLDIRMKEGNSKAFNVNAGIGLLSSRLALEGPLIKDKASFIVAARRTYFDLFFPISNNPNVTDSKAYFYDLTAKANWKINDKNTVFLSGYFGRDKFGFSDNFGFEWGNGTATLRWNNVISSRLFANYSLIYSNYDYGINITTGNDGFFWRSSIVNYSFKPEFTYFLNDKNTITFGGQALYYDFLPGRTTVRSQGSETINILPKKYSLESAIYIGNEQKINSRLSLQYGLRYSRFNYLGSGSALILGDTTPGEKRPIREIQQFGDNENIASYGNLEPRFSMKYEINTNSSIKASYNRMAQYLHLLSNTQASVPLDVWTPSTNNIKPQIADQVALGYFLNFGDNNMYEASAEVYYKDMQNQIDYIDGADLLLNRELEAELLTGKGRAYGFELFVKKRKGKINGWVSYTLARTERQVNGINRGSWYPTRFDRLHNLYLVGIYEYNKRLDFTASFILSSGVPGTFPTSRFEYQGIVVPHNSFDERNNIRLAPYHRLDISATLEGKKKEGRKWESSWTFAVYNVYARRNPFGIYFRQQPPNENERVAQSTNTEAIRFAVLGSFVPSATYNFRF